MDSRWNCHTNISFDPHLYSLPREAPASLLTSNDAPSSSESQEVSRNIADALVTLQNLQSKIEQARALLQECETARDSCESYITSHRRILSPTRHVPPEIWSVIFLCCQTEHDLSSWSGPFVKSPQLCSYGAVCSLWRSVTLNTPALWKHVPLSCPLPSAAAEAIDLWLQRSKQHPLFINIIGRGLDTSDEPIREQYFECVEMLLKHASRWQDFRLYMNEDGVDDDIMEFWPTTKIHAPLLQSCYLGVRNFGGTLIHNSTLLKSVTTAYIEIPPLLSWASVAKLELTGDTVYYLDEQAMYLKGCPSLEVYIIRSAGGADPHDDDTIPAFNHPTLKSLSLHGCRPNLLSGLEAAALTCLDLSCGEVRDDRNNTLQFIRRSPNLCTLSLRKQWSLIKDLSETEVENLTLFAGYEELGFISAALFELYECLRNAPFRVKFLSFKFDLTCDDANNGPFTHISFCGILEALMTLFQDLNPQQLQKVSIHITSSPMTSIRFQDAIDKISLLSVSEDRVCPLDVQITTE